MALSRDNIIKDFLSLSVIDRESYAEREFADALAGRLEEMGFSVTEDDAGSRIG